MKVQLTSEELTDIILNFCKEKLNYTPKEDVVQVIVDEDKLFAEFEVVIDVKNARKS